MVKITVKDDCGNSPKMQLLRDLNVAIAKHEPDFILENFVDAIRWNPVGGKVIEGKDKVVEAVAKVKGEKVAELTLTNIMTHGKIGAVDGVLTLENGKQIAFCDVYQFTSAAKDAKIKEITSYVIEL